MPEIEIEEEDYESQLTAPVLKRILGMIKPHWKMALGFMVSIALTSMVDSYFTFLNKEIVDKGILLSDFDQVLRIAKIYGVFIIVQSGMVFGFIYLAGILGERVQYDLRKLLFNHLQKLSLSFYSQTAVGRMMARVTSDTGRVSELVTWGILDVTWGTVSIVTSTIFMAIINWRLALIVFAIIPLMILTAVQFRKRILVEFRGSRKANSKITGSYNENIQGVRIVKALNREKENLKEFQGLTDRMFKTSYKAAWLSALFLPAVQIVSSIALGIIVGYGGLQISTGFITIGGIQAFVSYLTFMLWPIQDLARVYAEMQHSIASAERIFTMADTEPEVKNRTTAIPAKTLMGKIQFDHVDFYYEDRISVLSDFNLKVEPGETIALVGPTGGGKSTIVNLLCRFYEPQEGSIKINGLDYTDYTLESIHSKIGIVLQTPHLFSGSIRENIRYGKLSSTDEEVENASKIAGADNFIQEMSKGYDEEVGEGGNLLSVGQKQLISLARAVLAEPELFIMDEATSSVDTLTEALIQKGMENLMKGRTSFVIAHRLSTIRNADRILVIEEGKISEIGTHAELLRLKGHYYKLYTQQFRHELEVQYGVEEDPRLTGSAVSS
ncbi:MAG: ABC transporter ATP-binding protein [Chloroflexi bacterium]|jgi:ATP-binding cassette, subfamily B, bacterial|nr:ABC transporter ATP-binding protein [Chloroflexota bacterium]MBT4003789.1 ABC transporter ATP-binding protein [Chloroflexota bacterium]MBT4305691.1 ABC transporter ATP-binding protein [Chloroflexota bacterium]MBT4533515.1 ABC transporter ATP-binding protein [Chloroflexota bacterium]MBT4681842.1 ABC transporter ATP-binding protein [Chloroflexota bacterium]